MKKIAARLVLFAIVLLAQPAGALVFMEGGRRIIGSNQQDANYQQIVQQTLDASRDANQTAPVWRDTVEDRLVAIGPRALPFLKLQLPQRKGDLLDALQVAIFRLENTPLNPREAITAFAARTLPLGKSVDLQINHVRLNDIHRELFPHHLFYTFDTPAPTTHALLALAADGKIQSLSDDAALLKFMRTEAEPAETEIARERACTIAAALVLARFPAVIKSPDPIPTTDRHSAETQLTLPGQTCLLKLTFDDAGKLLTLSTTPL